MKLAAIIAAAVCLLIGIAIGIRRPCPQPVTEREQAYLDYADVQPPDPWPAAYWTTVGRA